MSVLANTEIDKLSVMYEGDKSRDASDKIRGFMFQDLVAIKCLLQNQVKYVCLEYLEDVDVFFEDDTIEVIQVKYYPNTTPAIKEISTDLYYQFLRFQMLSSTLKTAPRLYIHRNHAVRKPTFDEMKMYIGLGDKILKSVIYSEFGDLPTWLRKNVYSTNKKEEQKKKLFVNMASEETLREFIEKFVVEHKTSINEYKKEVMEALAVAYPNPDEDGDEENWQLILLGIAISYIQKRYELEDSDFEKLRVDKKEFDQYMTNSVETKTEETIASYLTGLVCEKYGEIVNNNDKLSDLQVRMLSLIYKNTLRWINSIGKTVEGQYQLVNTLSTWEASKVAGYKVKPIKNRLDNIIACEFTFLKFLSYLWKIILNICQEKVCDEKDISTYIKLFDPLYYIDLSVKDYVCLNFPADKYVDHCVILPPAAGEFKGVKRKVVGRMINISPKPEKWYFQNHDLMRGKNYYKYSTADVNENPTIADLGEDSFYIECMDCIGIDEDEWDKQEDCSSCIFSEKCIGEER